MTLSNVSRLFWCLLDVFCSLGAVHTGQTTSNREGPKKTITTCPLNTVTLTL